MTLDAVARVLAALTLGACHVYDETCVPRDNPAGGVNVRVVAELADVDAGVESESEWVEPRKL